LKERYRGLSSIEYKFFSNLPKIFVTIPVLTFN